MMITARDLSHQYTVWEKEKSFKRTALDHISLDVQKGEFVAILGANGSGKSTFAKHLNVLLLPDEGSVWVDGNDTKDKDKLWEIRHLVGMVFQNPDNQIVGSSVEEDTAFGPENQAQPSDVIRQKVENSLRAVGLWDKRKTSPHRLSGGQKQRVAIAGTLASDAGCIVFDEPTAMLDPASRREIMDMIGMLHAQGKTIILITHHTEETVGADRIFLMEKGTVRKEGPPEEIFAETKLLQALDMDIPDYMKVAEKLRKEGIPLELPTLDQADLVRQITGCYKSGVRIDSEDGNAQASCGEKADKSEKETILSVQHLSYAYDMDTAYACRVLEDVSFDIRENDFIGLIGSSGSGKTTLIKHLNGLLKADKGDVLYKGRSIYDRSFKLRDLRREVGLVFQYPEHQLFCNTVMKDVSFGPRNMGFSEEEAEKAAKESLRLVGLDESYYHISPLELSGGQMRRVAIAGVLAMKPKILIMDEPAAGLDPGSKRRLFELMNDIRKAENIALVFVSHEMEDVATYMDRVLVLREGRIEKDGTVRDVFTDVEGLKSIGIGIPQVTAVTDALIKEGLPIRNEVTVERAADSILGAFTGKRGTQL